MTERRDELSEPSGDEFSVRELVQTLWSYRRVYVTGLAVTFILYIAAILFLYVRLPKETIAAMGFRLTFEGADQNRFPNGSAFSSAEIVSMPVLAEVIRKNDLQRYTSLPALKDSMFVLEANPAVELLDYEYQSKLADPKLTPVERTRLEEEFRKKRDSMKSAFFSLNFRRSARVLMIPDTVLQKVLQDTLSTWAEQAAERKGAVRYNIAIPSRNALHRDFLAAEDYVVAVDVLRSTIDRTLKAVQEIATIPGVQAIRMGTEQYSLEDLRGNLEDLERFKVQPLLGVVRASGLSRNSAGAVGYFSDRLLQVQLTREQVRSRVEFIQEALRRYQETGGGQPKGPGADSQRTAAVTPQISDSFIDRLVQLSTQAADIEYRKDLTNRVIHDGMELADLNRQADYYELMAKSFASHRGERSPAMEAEVTRRTNELFADLTKSLDSLQALFIVISQQNLNPDAMLYTITRPFATSTISTLTPRSVFSYLLITMFGALILIPVGCLAHDYFRHWISPRGPRADGMPRRGPSSREVAGV